MSRLAANNFALAFAVLLSDSPKRLHRAHDGDDAPVLTGARAIR